MYLHNCLCHILCSSINFRLLTDFRATLFYWHVDIWQLTLISNVVKGASFLSLIIVGFQGKTPLFLNPLMALATVVHLSKTILKNSINVSLSYDFLILLDNHFGTSCLYIVFTNPINSRLSACSKCVEFGRYVLEWYCSHHKVWK